MGVTRPATTDEIRNGEADESRYYEPGDNELTNPVRVEWTMYEPDFSDFWAEEPELLELGFPADAVRELFGEPITVDGKQVWAQQLVDYVEQRVIAPASRIAAQCADVHALPSYADWAGALLQN